MSGYPPLNGGAADDMVTTGVTGIRRYKVESIGTTEAAYDEGRRFRAFYEFALASSEVRVLKFLITKDLDLTFSAQFVDDGGLRYRVYGQGPIEGGTFSPAGFVAPSNSKTGVPVVDPGLSLWDGGTLDTTGFTPRDVSHILTAGASGQRITVDGQQISLRGFPPTAAYVVLDKLPASVKEPSGLLKYEWTVSV